MSVHFLLQTNGFKQSISFEDLVHLQVFFTTCRHCGQSPGWHFSGQLWPQSSFFSQVLWHRGASSVQGRPLGAGVFPHGHVFLCARGHSPQSPGQQIFSQLWWPLIPRTTLIMRQAQQAHNVSQKKTGKGSGKKLASVRWTDIDVHLSFLSGVGVATDRNQTVYRKVCCTTKQVQHTLRFWTLCRRCRIAC